MSELTQSLEATVRNTVSTEHPSRIIGQIQWIDATHVHFGKKVVVPMNRAIATDAMHTRHNNAQALRGRPLFVRHHVLVVVVDEVGEGAVCDMSDFDKDKR